MKRLLSIAAASTTALFVSAAAMLPLTAAAQVSTRIHVDIGNPAPVYVHERDYGYGRDDGYRRDHYRPVERRYYYVQRHGGHRYYQHERRGRRDLDRDGVPDRYDRDLDNDGIANRYDRDVDGDGIRNRRDRRPANPYAY